VNGVRLYDDAASGNCYKARLLLALADKDCKRVPVDILGTNYLPDGALARARAVQWLHFEQEWIMPGIGSARFYALTGRHPELLEARRARGRRALAMLDEHLAAREWVAADACSIADISLFAYTHVAPDAGIDLAEWPAVQRWIDRIEALPGFMDDYVPYPNNARPGRGRSIYDE
jgi:glutathione S-transferase